MHSNNKILLVSINNFFGGGEVHFIKLAKLLTQFYEIRALVVDPRTAQILREANIDIIQVSPHALKGVFGKYFHTGIQLTLQCMKFLPQIVQLNGQGECYLSIIPKVFRCRIVSTRHLPFNEHIQGIRRFLVRFNLSLTDMVICVSTLIQKQLNTFIPQNRLVMIPNWMNFIPSVPPDKAFGKDGILKILFVGRLEKIKGIFDLIEAMKCVTGASLEVVGDGSCMQQARQAAAGLPITFHGFQADCTTYYQRADLLVFPSHPDLEGQGQVPFEAMAFGLPCLVSDIEVALETCDNGACAEVYSHGDHKQLAEKIMFLKDTPDRLVLLRKRGLDRFRSTYTTRAVATQYRQVFDQLIR